MDRNRVPSGVLFLKGAVQYIGDPTRALILKTTPMMMVSVGLGLRVTASHCKGGTHCPKLGYAEHAKRPRPRRDRISRRHRVVHFQRFAGEYWMHFENHASSIKLQARFSCEDI